MNVTEKIKEILNESDLAKFEEGVERMISDRVAQGVTEKVAILETELKAKYDTISEQYVTEKVKNEVDTKIAELVTENDQKLATLEKKVITRLGAFLDKVVNESISDEILEKVAINEVALPIVQKIRGIFEDSHIEVSTDAQKSIEESETKVKRTEKLLSESISKNMLLEERLEKLAVFLLISERSQGLTGNQKKKIVEEFKSANFEDVDAKIDGFVKLIKEADSKPVEKTIVESAGVKTQPRQLKRKTVDSMIAENDSFKVKKETITESEEIDQSFSIVDVASDYFYE